jgi:RTX calcium-binding nonapeptide repeat (4 copies)
MTLRRFSFGSATEVISGATGEQADCGEVGFGFADGYDFGAGSKAGLCEGPFKGIPDEAYTISAVEADFCEIFRGEICVAGEDHMAGIGVIVDWRSVLRRSAPIPDSQCGTGSTAGPGEAAEAQDAGDRVMESTVDGGSAGRIDTVEARVTGYTLANGVENLVLFGTVASGTGNSLDNFLIGNAANNSLNGGVGNDTLSAAGSNRGLGQRDTLTRGAGNDVFILADENVSFYDDSISSSTGVADFAYITDFNASQDSLVLSGSAEEYSLILGIFLPVWPALREPATMIFSESRVRRMSWLQ